MKRRHPFYLIVLVVVLLLISWFGWLRLQQSIAFSSTLVQVGIQVPPLYLGVSGAAMGLAFLASALWLWFGWPWYIPLTGVTAVFFSLWYWLDRLLLAKSESSQANLPFVAGLNLFLLAYTFAALALDRGQKRQSRIEAGSPPLQQIPDTPERLDDGPGD